MALQTKDPAFMAGLAKLAQEEMDEIIRWSVKKEGVIDIRFLDRDVNALVAPFAEYGHLFQIAKEEVFRVNTFRMSMGDTEIDDILRCQPGEYESGESAGLPILESLTTGPISADFHKIRHLEVHFGIRLQGANFQRAEYEPILCFDDDMSMIHHNLHRLLPELETLDVKVHNSGLFRDKGWTSYTLPSGAYLKAADPAAEVWAKREQMMHMHAYLLWFGAMYDPPTLRKKSVELIQKATSSPPVKCDGSIFHREHGLRTIPECSESYCWKKCQAAVMDCEMLGFPKQALLAVLPQRIIATAEEIAHVLDLESGKKALDIIEHMLYKCDRAIVHFPCRRRVVRKEETSDEAEKQK